MCETDPNKLEGILSYGGEASPCLAAKKNASIINHQINTHDLPRRKK